MKQMSNKLDAIVYERDKNEDKEKCLNKLEPRMDRVENRTLAHEG